MNSKERSKFCDRENKNLTGTARYASVNTHLGVGKSSVLLFCFVFAISLPWQGLKAGTKKQKYDVVSEKKVSTPIEVKKQLDNHWSTPIFSGRA